MVCLPEITASHFIVSIISMRYVNKISIKDVYHHLRYANTCLCDVGDILYLREHIIYYMYIGMLLLHFNYYKYEPEEDWLYICASESQPPPLYLSIFLPLSLSLPFLSPFSPLSLPTLISSFLSLSLNRCAPVAICTLLFIPLIRGTLRGHGVTYIYWI